MSSAIYCAYRFDIKYPLPKEIFNFNWEASAGKLGVTEWNLIWTCSAASDSLSPSPPPPLRRQCIAICIDSLHSVAVMHEICESVKEREKERVMQHEEGDVVGKTT